MTVRKLAGVVVLGAATWGAASAPCEEHATAEPEHYRNEDYRAPTPATLHASFLFPLFYFQFSLCYVLILAHIPRIHAFFISEEPPASFLVCLPSPGVNAPYTTPSHQVRTLKSPSFRAERE